MREWECLEATEKMKFYFGVGRVGEAGAREENNAVRPRGWKRRTARRGDCQKLGCSKRHGGPERREFALALHKEKAMKKKSQPLLVGNYREEIETLPTSDFATVKVPFTTLSFPPCVEIK